MRAFQFNDLDTLYTFVSNGSRLPFPVRSRLEPALALRLGGEQAGVEAVHPLVGKIPAGAHRRPRSGSPSAGCESADRC
jgi:hypothetical protein